MSNTLSVTINRLGISTLIKDGMVNLYHGDGKKLDAFVAELKSSGAIPKEKHDQIQRQAKPAGEEGKGPDRHWWAANLSYDIPVDAFDMEKLEAMSSQRKEAAAAR